MMLNEAAERVNAFLARRKQMNGLDPMYVAELDGGEAAGGHSLTVADLEELIHIAEEYETLAADVKERWE